MSRPREVWDRHFLRHAKLAAELSTCLRVPDGVGCVLVNPERKTILVTGFAGSVRNEKHCTDEGVGCMIVNGGCQRTVHAELNAVIQAAENGVSIRGATAYVTLSPCWTCWQALVNAGVNRVVFARLYRVFEQQREMADRRGIELVHFPLDDSDEIAHTAAAAVPAPSGS